MTNTNNTNNTKPKPDAENNTIIVKRIEKLLNTLETEELRRIETYLYTLYYS